MVITSCLKSHVAIVKPEKATRSEEFAASELQKYLAEISGVIIPITADCDQTTGNAIAVGGPERNRIAAAVMPVTEFRRIVPGPDGMLIKTFGDNVLVLAGGGNDQKERDRGTIYVVYEFLERFLGCGFTAYGKPGAGLGEYIPHMPNIEIINVEYIKDKADLSYRTAIVHFDGFAHEKSNSDANHGLTASFIVWMAKNRLNRILFMMNSYETIKSNGMLEEIKKRGISITVGHHDSSMFFLPPQGSDVFPEKYFETHPEFYRLLPDGSRFQPESKWKGQLIFDMRNPECIKQIAGNMMKWLKQNPCVDIVNLWPNDGDDPQCVCSECLKHSKMANYAWFVNEVAKLVNEEHPHVKIDMIVYLDLWELPQDVELGPGVLVEVATWGPNYILRRFGMKDGTGLIGTGVEKNAMEWSRIAGGMVYYDYYMTNFDSKQVYCPMADEIVRIYESFKEKGYCFGTGSQMESYNLWNYLFNFYTHGRKSYDVSLSMDDLLDRFSRIFGKGGGYVREYIRYVENFFEGQAANGTGSAAWFAANVDRDRVYGLFEKAYEAEPEGKLRDNIRLLRMAFRYSDLYIYNPGCDELKYMSNEFGGYWGCLDQIGYGIAVFDKPEKTSFIPDKWYVFSQNC